MAQVLFWASFFVSPLVSWFWTSSPYKVDIHLVLCPQKYDIFGSIIKRLSALSAFSPQQGGHGKWIAKKNDVPNKSRLFRYDECLPPLVLQIPCEKLFRHPFNPRAKTTCRRDWRVGYPNTQSAHSYVLTLDHRLKLPRYGKTRQTPCNSAGALFGMVKTWPFQRLSDLQLGDWRVTNWITWHVNLGPFCSWLQVLHITFNPVSMPRCTSLATGRNQRYVGTVFVWKEMVTLPKFNIAPEKLPSQ